jgi:hypothetical protein
MDWVDFRRSLSSTFIYFGLDDFEDVLLSVKIMIVKLHISLREFRTNSGSGYAADLPSIQPRLEEE